MVYETRTNIEILQSKILLTISGLGEILITLAVLLIQKIEFPCIAAEPRQSAHATIRDRTNM